MDRAYPKSQWAQINGTIYRFNESNYMAEGWFAENGKWYYLRTDSAMLANTITPDNYIVGVDGA